MNAIKEHFKKFIRNEDGFELLQVAIVVLIVAALAVVIWRISDGVNTKLGEAEKELNEIQIHGDY